MFLPPWRPISESVTVADPNVKVLRVGLVFDVGGRGDKSFNDAAYGGLARARDEFNFDVSYLEPAGSEDREAAMRLFASRGFDLVIGVGFIFSSDINEVALEYPNVRFACVDYTPNADPIPPNVAGIAFHEEEGAFLAGSIAGLLSKTEHVGFIGGMDSPIIRKFEVGYAAGVKAVCPKCIVHAAYAGGSPDAFRDPAKGKSLTISQIAAGADVFFHASGATGHGVFEAAHDAHAIAIGVDSDQYSEMPDTIVTSMLKRGDVAVYEIAKAVALGNFVGGMHMLGLKEGALDFVRGEHAARLPESVIARTDELRSEIIEGKRHVPSR